MSDAGGRRTEEVKQLNMEKLTNAQHFDDRRPDLSNNGPISRTVVPIPHTRRQRTAKLDRVATTPELPPSRPISSQARPNPSSLGGADGFCLAIAAGDYLDSLLLLPRSRRDAARSRSIAPNSKTVSLIYPARKLQPGCKYGRLISEHVYAAAPLFSSLL